MSLFYDIMQNGRIHGAEQSAASASARAIDAGTAASDLRQRVEMLALANQALFELVQEKLGITETDVLKLMAEIDVRDGIRDGRMSPKILSCTKCGRKVNSTRQQCMYCGERIVGGSPFQKGQVQ
jgi:hypothetical protein